MKFSTSLSSWIARRLWPRNGIENRDIERVMSQERTSAVNQQVLDFYKTLPFNVTTGVEGACRIIRENDLAQHYGLDSSILNRKKRVLEVGCGVGWLSNSIAYHQRAPVVAIDFNPIAVERARETAAALRVSATFEVADLFTYEPERPFDLVISFGVLHHTDDCMGAVARLCERFAAPGGLICVGLYHAYGRRPFLDHFAEMKARGCSEDEMMARYAELDPRFADDPVHLSSWFRDQVMHPHETQHTLREVCSILDTLGLTLARTSINRHEPISSVSDLFEEEKRYEEYGARKLAGGEYFPGMFTFVARKS